MGQLKEPNSYEQQLVSLGRILQTMREGDSVAVVIDAVLAYLRTYASYELVWIGLYDAIDHRVCGKGGKSPLGQELPFLKQPLALDPGDVFEQVIMQQQGLTIPDLQAEQRAGEWRKLAQKASIQGTTLLPIVCKSACYGVLLLGSRLWGNFPKTEEKERILIVLGELATALEAAETEWKRQQIKQLDQPMLDLLGDLRSLPNLGRRLAAIVEQSHRFIQPTRTSVYWFERSRRYFWRRVTHQKPVTRFGEDHQLVSGLTVQEMSSFYQALVSDQVVSIGESMSSLKGDATSRIMQHMRARSLLAAPILYQDELLGFLATEGSEPRIWQDSEKQFIRAAAQLVALVAPLEEIEHTIEQTKLDRALTAEIAHAIYSTNDWKQTLTNAADLMSKRLKLDRFFVLLYDPDQQHFEVCYQSHPKNRRSLNAPLGMLSLIDWKLLERQEHPTSIENLQEDLRFAAWRTTLLELGVRSLLVCNTSPGQTVEGILILGQEAPRAWSHPEAELAQVVARQLGVILRQWQLQRQHEQEQKISQAIQWGLSTIQQTQHLELLERSALLYLTQVLQAPLAIFVAWSAGRRVGRLVQSSDGSTRWSINCGIKVAIETDPLLQRALNHEGILALSVDELPVETQQWLTASGIGQLLVVALRTAPEHEPTGVVVIADTLERLWLDRYLSAFTVLVSQFAWSRRYLMVSETLRRDRDRLEHLSWYKHRRLEDLYRTVKTGMKRLNEIPAANTNELLVTRQQQILRQVEETIDPVRQVIRDEQWQLTIRNESIPMLSIVRRALDRVETLIKQRQLWSQVHHDINPIILGDIPKIELVLYELLLIACQRSQVGGRIDIWCRPVPPDSIELLLTDDGTIEPRLVEDLETGRAVDLLAPSTLDKPPGLHLAICKALMQQMNAEFNFYQLEDRRILSRLVLPIV
jgi:GAF domain-containing protein